MPIQLPVYERRLGQAGLPTVRQRGGVGPDAFGAGIAEGLQRGGMAVADGMQKLQDEADQAVIDQTYADLVNEKNKLLTEYTSQHGLNAVNGADAVRERWEKLIEHRIGAVSEERLQGRLKSLASHESVNLSSAVMRHRADQAEVVRDQSFKSALGAAVSDMSRATRDGDDEAAGMAYSMGLARVREQSRRMGLDGTASKSAELEFTTAAHGGVLEELARRDDFETANEYLEAHKAEIDAKAFGKIRDDIEAAGIRGKSRDMAAEIVNTVRSTMPTKWDFDLGLALEAAAEFPEFKRNPNLADAVVDRIHQAHAAMQRDRRSNDEPKLGRIDQEIWSAEVGRARIDKQSRDWMDLSDEGRATAEHNLLSRQRDDRREQTEWDQTAKYRYLNQPTPDRRDMSIDTDPILRGASRQLREELKVHQRQLKEDNGVKADAFDARINEDIARSKYKDKKAAAFRIVMRDEYKRWKSNPDNQKQEPGEDAINQMFARAHSKVLEPGPLSDILNLVGQHKAAEKVRNEREAWEARSEDIEKQQSKEPKPSEPVQPVAPLTAAGRRGVETGAPISGISKAVLESVTSVDQIPKAERQQIREAFKRKYGRVPTASEIMSLRNRRATGSR